MHEALRSIHQPHSTAPVRDSRRQGREQKAPFRFDDPPPAEADETQPPPGAARAFADHRDVGHRLDDEEGQKLDVTA